MHNVRVDQINTKRKECIVDIQAGNVEFNLEGEWRVLNEQTQFGGNISFPKSIFRLEKGFSLEFKSYGWEDLELGYRFKKRNIPLFYLTSAINYHYHVISDDEKVERKYSMGQSAQIFINKHPELKLFLGHNPVSIFFRKKLSYGHFLLRIISKFKNSKISFLRKFSFWFLGEFNYLSGLLNLSRD